MKTFGKTTQALIFVVLLPQLVLLEDSKVDLKSSDVSFYCINAAYPPCTNENNNSRICDEYMNKYGPNKCFRDEDCVRGRKCEKSLLGKECGGITTLEFKICELTKKTLKKYTKDNKYEICIGDTSSLRSCMHTAKKDGDKKICNEFLNIQGPSSCNHPADCLAGRHCSGNDKVHGKCYFNTTETDSFRLSYISCSDTILVAEKPTTMMDSDGETEFDLCENEKLKACKNNGEKNEEPKPEEKADQTEFQFVKNDPVD